MGYDHQQSLVIYRNDNENGLNAFGEEVYRILVCEVTLAGKQYSRETSERRMCSKLCSLTISKRKMIVSV